MNNVVVRQDAASLMVSQRHSLAYKLLMSALLLLVAACPLFGLYIAGLNGTLTCAREPAVGVVCTDRVDWLGAFPRASRYDRVERAEVLTTKSGRSIRSRLRLITAAGPIVFSADHHTAYASAAGLINRFIEDPPAAPLILSAGSDRTMVISFGGVLLAIAYFFLSVLLRKGSLALFDANRGSAFLRREGVLRPNVAVLRLNEIVNVYATRGSTSNVFLMTGDAKRMLCWFSNVNSPDAAAAGRELADRISAWLALQRERGPGRDSAPAPADLAKVAHPILVYLLRHSRNGTVVRQGEHTFLRLDRIGGGPREQQTLRRLLDSAANGSGDRSTLTARLLADELIGLCQIDLREARAAATPEQRRQLEALLKSAD